MGNNGELLFVVNSLADSYSFKRSIKTVFNPLLQILLLSHSIFNETTLSELKSVIGEAIAVADDVGGDADDDNDGDGDKDDADIPLCINSITPSNPFIKPVYSAILLVLLVEESGLFNAMSSWV